jgi:hypothetical protein
LARRKKEKPLNTPLVGIFGQAIDSATKDVYVLVQWAGLDEATWIPVVSLSPLTQTWWSSEIEKRFPWMDLPSSAPVLRLSGGPVTLVYDYTTDERI